MQRRSIMAGMLGAIVGMLGRKAAASAGTSDDVKVKLDMPNSPDVPERRTLTVEFEERPKVQEPTGLTYCIPPTQIITCSKHGEIERINANEYQTISAVTSRGSHKLKFCWACLLEKIDAMPDVASILDVVEPIKTSWDESFDVSWDESGDPRGDLDAMFGKLRGKTNACE